MPTSMTSTTSTSFLRPSLPAVAAAVLGALLSGCAVTRVDPPAPVTAPAQYKEDGLWKQARPATAEPVPEQWWTLFDDPVLNDLQRRLVIGNENLKAAVAQLAGARAALEASRSALLPTLSVGVSGTRSASPDGNVTNGTINRGPTNSVQASLNASWEPDLWGRLRLASAGHEPPLLRQANGDAGLLALVAGPPLGFEPSGDFPLYEGVLAAGAILLGYTDGVTEAFDLEHRPYGSEPLLHVLATGDNAERACQRVLDDVRRHAGQAPQSDDITILAISRRHEA